jgi:uroporphyrinogen decarboxylase
VLELPDFDPGDPRDPKWITHSDWNYDFAGLNVAQAVAQQGSQRAIIAHLWGIVEGTSRVIGIENCWLNLGAQPKIMAAWFDRYADWLCGLVDNVADTGVDIITLSDDWGSNQTMLFSPRMWRNLIAPYATRVVKHAHDRGLLVNLHSDGYIMQIMDDLLAIGYDSTHPVQESSGMDPVTIKEKYGDQDHHLWLARRDRRAAGLRGRDALEEYITRPLRDLRAGRRLHLQHRAFRQPDIPPARLVHAYTVVKRLAQQYHTP